MLIDLLILKYGTYEPYAVVTNLSHFSLRAVEVVTAITLRNVCEQLIMVS